MQNVNNAKFADSSLPIKQCVQEKEYLTVKDIQTLLQLSRSKAYSLVNSKVFPILKIGKVIRIPKKTFDEWRTITGLVS